MMEPEVIFFDEPLAFLDPPGRQLFLEILQELGKVHKTLFVATHDLNFAAEWGERFLVLESGRITRDGDRRILREGIQAFLGARPLTTEIFSGFVPKDELPVTVAESRKILERF